QNASWLAAAFAAGVILSGCSKPNADEHLAKGDDYMTKSLLNEAILEYRAAVQADSMRGDAHLKLGDAFIRKGEFGPAMREYVKAADLLPGDVLAQVKAGQMLLLARAFEDAQTRARKALDLQANNVDALVLIGIALAGLKDLDGAIAEYQEAISLNPKEEAAYTNMGAIQFARGDKAQAEATFRKAVEAASGSVGPKLALANFLWATSRFKDSEEAFKSALALEPTNASANRALGVFYMSTGRAPEAEQFFKTIAETAKTADASISLSDDDVATGLLPDAKKVLEELAKDPNAFASATVRLAAIEAAGDNRAGAHVLTDKVLEKQPKYIPARLLSLRLLLADRKHDEAMAAAQALVKDEPGSAAAAEAFLAIGAVEASRDRTDDAARAFQETLKIDPRSVRAAIDLGRVYLAAGFMDRAETYIKQATDLQPANPVARSLMVRLAIAKGDVARATSELATLEKAYPNSLAVQNLSATRHLATGRVDAARAAYAKVAAIQPNDLESLQGLIAVDLAQNRKKEAVDRVDAALKRMAPSSELLMMAARTYGASGDMKRTEEALKKAIDVDPHRLVAYGLLGSFYVSQKRLADARDQFTEIITRNPRSVSANTMLDMIMEAQGDAKAAETQYQKTLGIDPESPVAANNLAWILVASDRNLDQAAQLAKAALKQLPDSPQVNDTMGWIYYKTGVYELAARHLEQSLRRDQSDPSVHFHLGMTYVKLNDPAKARTSLEKALSINPQFAGAAEAKTTLSSLKRG